MENIEKLDLENIEISNVLEALKKSKNYNIVKDLPISFIYFTDDSLQIAFLSENLETLKIFYLKNKENKTQIVFSEEENVTIDEKRNEQKINLDEIKISYSKTKDLFNDFLKKNYSKTKLLKIFYILQNSNLGLIWNITGLCADFDVLNVKICAKTGNILEFSKEQMFYYDIQELKDNLSK
ncbi:MAG: hypothetical protein QW210_00285 [Candidatus Woesearchaeota archaeon]